MKKRPSADVPEKTLVIDNGGFTIKAGLACAGEETPQLHQCRIIPNCVARSRDRHVYIGAQLENCKDFGEMAFRRPVEKGYLVNWESEKAIWEGSFFEKNAAVQCDPHDTNLILTEAPNCPAQLQINSDQIVFEEFEFASYYRTIGPRLNFYNDIPPLFGDPNALPDAAPECLLVIDSGFSHTTITPLLHASPIQPAIRRLSIGGRFLTNYLKDLISLRQYNVIDEFHLVNEIKEATSFVSSDFCADIEASWKGNLRSSLPRKGTVSPLLVDYVLPDYDKVARGYIRPHDSKAAGQAAKMKAQGGAGAVSEDVLPLGNERFVVPELLFRPDDLGMQEDGIPETVLQSLEALPKSLWPAMLGNVLVVGGTSLIPGFVERLETELRRLIPAEFPLRVKRPEDPIRSTWLGGARMASHRETLRQVVATRQEYMELGPNWLLRRFGSLSTLK